jgi:hypothetical protein
MNQSITIPEILEELNLDNGSNYKLDVLKKHKDNELLKRVFAMALECPIYAMAEHLFELGLAEVSVLMQDDALKEQLIRHLAKGHVLVGGIDAEKLECSHRAAHLKEALRLLDEELIFKDTEPIPERLQARVDRIMAAMHLIQLHEVRGVSLQWINQLLNYLDSQAQRHESGE